ncbi:MAG: ABC transporter permease, partial [Candidatus Aenigmatarchaeota archaeon]
MWDLALKNIMRNRTRTTLTVLGILIGIGAIVALGSIAEGIDATVRNGLELAAGKIIVTERDSGFFGMGGELTDEDIDVIKNIAGIKDVVPILVYFEMSGFQGPDFRVIGINPEKTEYFVTENIKMYEGRRIEEGESGVAMVGKTVADNYNI